MKTKECKDCGHEGDKENPLAQQGDQQMSYCVKCMNIASKKAGENYTKRK